MIESIGEFRVKAELGRGGMGRVFRAHDSSMDRDVAIKVLTSEGDSDLLGRFRSEAGTTAKLRHQNIVTVYAYGEQDGLPYLVMELLEGHDLGHIIREHTPLSLLHKVRIMHQVAEGLAYAHQNHVIHRDIKPANIMLQSNGCVKIMDFGIARVTGRDSTRRTQQGFLVGTISYMAPEQFKLGIDADELVDIFAFGDVFYELVTGEHPFHAEDPGTLIYRITSVEPKPVREAVPDCPESLAYIIHQLLSKDRDLRYQSVRDVVLDIEPVLFQLRRERAEQILQEAHDLIAQGQADAALTKVKEALEVDPVSGEAQRLRNELQRELHAQAVRVKVSAMLAEANGLVAQRQFSQAIPILENALRLDKSEALQARLAMVRGEQDRFVRAGQLLGEARREAHKRNLALAYRRASEAVDLDPGNTEALRLAQRIHEDLKHEEREQALREATQSAAVRAADGDFEEALRILDQSIREHGETPELEDARTSVLGRKADFEWKQRHKRFQNAVSDARVLLTGGKLAETHAAIDRIVSEFADWPELTRAVGLLRGDLADRERGMEIARIERCASELSQHKKYLEARAQLESGLAKYPDHPILRAALENVLRENAALDRANAIAQAEEKIIRLRQADLAQALRNAELAQREYPEHTPFAALVSELGAERRERQRSALVDEALSKANSLLARDPSQAAELLRRTLAAVGQEPRMESLLALAEQATATLSEQQAVDGILMKVQTLRSAHQWSKALQELERGNSRYPHRSELLTAAAEVRAEIDRVSKAERLLSLSQEIENALSDRDWSKGLNLIETARREFPGDRGVEQLSRELAGAKLAHELADLAGGVRRCLSGDDLEGAQRKLVEHEARFGSEAEWQSLKEELDHRRQYLQALEEARGLESQSRFQEAETALGRIAQNPAADERAGDLLRSVSKKRLRAEVELREQRREEEARELARKEHERKEAQALEAARRERERKEAQAREQERKDAEERERIRREQDRQQREKAEQLAAAREAERGEAPTVSARTKGGEAPTVVLPAMAGPSPVEEPLRDDATAILSGIYNTPAPAPTFSPVSDPAPPFTVIRPETQVIPAYRRITVIAPVVAAAMLLGYFALRSPSASEGNELHPSPPLVKMTYRAGSAPPSAEIDLGKLAVPVQIHSTVPWLSGESRNAGRSGKILIQAHPSALKFGTYDGEIRLSSADKRHVPAEATIPVHLVVVPGAAAASKGPSFRVPSDLVFDYRDGQPLPRPKQIQLQREPGSALQTRWQNAKDAAWARVEPGPQGLTVSVRPTGMSVGKHTAVLIIDVPGSLNTPQRVSITLNINSTLGNLTFKSGQEQISWRGGLQPGQVLTIQGATCSIGSLAAGELPASLIEIDTEGSPHLKIDSHPSRQNGFKLQLRNIGSEPIGDFILYYRAVK
jgi:hypothetical protein